jgi:hypothetical protein
MSCLIVEESSLVVLDILSTVSFCLYIVLSLQDSTLIAHAFVGLNLLPGVLVSSSLHRDVSVTLGNNGQPVVGVLLSGIFFSGSALFGLSHLLLDVPLVALSSLKQVLSFASSDLGQLLSSFLFKRQSSDAVLHRLLCALDVLVHLNLLVVLLSILLLLSDHGVIAGSEGAMRGQIWNKKVLINELQSLLTTMWLR